MGKSCISLFSVLILFSACNPLFAESISSPISTQHPVSTFTVISEESLIATEQARARTVQAEVALTLAAQPTQTPQPTLTSVPAHLPTLTLLPNSTPDGNGAYFDVPSDVLGPQYEIESAYYFDDLETGERYEFYAGAIAGSGNEETAQGVMVLRVLRFSEKGGNAEVIETQEYLTPIQAGPLRMEVDFTGSILLFTPLHFEWTFIVHQRELFNLYNYHPPLATLDIGEEKQLAGRGSFCWKGSCVDSGIYTSSIPLVVQSPFTAHVHLPLVEPPNGLWLYTMAVSPPGPLKYENVSDLGASWSSEKPDRELVNQGALLLRRDQDIKLSLEPGYYVLVIFATWRDYGDVQYGFLIDVRE